MDNDDLTIGRVLTRREVVRLLGVGGFAAVSQPWHVLAAQTGLPACVVKPEMTEGPYFVDEQLDRSDIRIDPSTGAVSPGVALALVFQVSRISTQGCAPLAGAAVDLWQCDAAGVYSDVSDRRFGNTVGQKFLRGRQVTGADGLVRFATIHPGWYAGRAVHIHFKIRTTAASGSAYEFTSQLFFDEALNDRVHALEPYRRKGRRDTTNDRDGIFRRGGDQLVLAPVEREAGYDATFAIGLDLTDAAAGQPDGGRGRGRGRGGM